MADNFVEELLVGLGFDFDGEDGEQFKKQTEVIASTINKISVAAGVASAALFAMTKTQASTNDEFGKTATTIDSSVESLAQWRHAAELAGVPGEQVVNMLERLKTVAQDAARTGAGPFQAYAELGVDFQALADGSLDVADGLQNILAHARTLDRTLAQSALRELGIDVRLLELSPTDIQAAFSAADQFSGVTSDLAAQSAEFTNAWAGVQLRLGGVANDLTGLLIPSFIKLFDTMQTGLEWLQTVGIPILDEVVELIGGWDVALSVLAGAAGLTAVVTAFSAILGTVKLIGAGLAGVISSAGAASTILAPLLAVAAAGAGGVAVGTAISENLDTETKDLIGEGIARTLAFLGNEQAQRAVDINDKLKVDAEKEKGNRVGQTIQPIGGVRLETTTSTEKVNNNVERFVETFNNSETTTNIEKVNNSVERFVETFNNSETTTNTAEVNNSVERFVEAFNNTSSLIREITETTNNVVRETSTIFETPDGDLTSIVNNMNVVADEVRNVEAVTPESTVVNVSSVDNRGVSGQPIVQGGSKSIVNNNTFNGLKTSEIEAMMTQKEREQNEFLDNDADDAIVR